MICGSAAATGRAEIGRGFMSYREARAKLGKAIVGVVASGGLDRALVLQVFRE
jgi:hypothetical protein